MRAIYWFRHDLRLDDNPGLTAVAADASELLLLYIKPTYRPWCNLQGISEQRERFLAESLKSLQTELIDLSQNLLVMSGSPELILPDIIKEYRIDALYTAKTPGVYEERALNVVTQKTSVNLKTFSTNTLFSDEMVADLFSELPGTFSPFRRQVEKSLLPIAPQHRPDTLPQKLALNYHSIYQMPTPPHVALPIRGGSKAGHRRLKQFLGQTGGIRQYKQTRNQLDPLGGTSTLSPWLADGSLSVRRTAQAISQHEAEYGQNDSTYWLYFELLWREYFHWVAFEDPQALFKFGGRDNETPLTTFNARNFARWCAGDTNVPLVNALMHQLTETGWMSNRGRQIAASYLVKELQVDWRYGAAFFEKHLIDYDVASNYGNWQYIAGVGVDPRGGRHFNQEKQSKQFDPEGIFTAKWDGFRRKQPTHVVDAADWPVLPE